VIPYSKQIIDKKDIRNVTKILSSDFLTSGPILKKFENKIKKYTKSKYSLCVNSATSALHISCMALGLGKGDYFWTVPNSFISTATSGLLCGSKVDFVDIDYQTNNISIRSLKDKLFKAKKYNKLPKVIIPVHLTGNPCEMDKIYNLSKEYNFRIIEDASHAFGAKYKNNNIGSCKWSDITVFSFHPVKIFTTAEGGSITTNNKKIYELASLIRDNGIQRDSKKFMNISSKKWYYEHQILGYNYRMNEIQAGLGISQISKLNKFYNERNKIKKYYLNKLSILSEKIILPTYLKNSKSSLHLFVIKIKKKYFNRDKLKIKLLNYGINTNVHYMPIHLQPYFKKLGFKKNQFPLSEKYGEEALSLPIYPYLDKKTIDFIIKKIFKILK
tara:strand:- start:439 stop:1596 length:1158 start_codon:yes stop_codon:yes gene_type:complete